MLKRMRGFWVLVLSLLLCMVLLPLPAARAAAKKTLTVSFSVTTYQNRARTALERINKARKAAGVQPLTMAADLEKVAVQRAAELFVFFDHARPDLSDYDTADDEYAAVKGATAVAECIAAGYSKADDAVADWMDSAAELLLDGDFTHAGVACVQVKDSYNEYYWALYLSGQPKEAKVRKAADDAKAAKTQTVKVQIAKGMYARADSSHKRFELRVNDLSLKTQASAQPAVYLYDRYGVRIGRCETADLTFKSSNTAVFTVLKDGTVKRKKAGTATLTIKADGLDAATCNVIVGGAGASGVTAATIREVQPELAAAEYSDHTNLSVYVKGASGYVLYRANAKGGSYSKVYEQATTKRWTLRLEAKDISRVWYYKVRAYKNQGGKRIYSEYSAPVRVAP